MTSTFTRDQRLKCATAALVFYLDGVKPILSTASSTACIHSVSQYYLTKKRFCREIIELSVRFIVSFRSRTDKYARIRSKSGLICTRAQSTRCLGHSHFMPLQWVQEWHSGGNHTASRYRVELVAGESPLDSQLLALVCVSRGERRARSSA